MKKMNRRMFFDSMDFSTKINPKTAIPLWVLCGAAFFRVGLKLAIKSHFSKPMIYGASIATLAGNLFAQGVIVPNGIVTNQWEGESVPEIDLSWPQETQINGFTLTPIGKQPPTLVSNIFNFNEPVTIGVRVFIVQSGETVSLQPLLGGSYLELEAGQNYVFRPGVPFYVGLYSGANVAPPYPPALPFNYLDPVFGWAELENVNGSIMLLNSALEYQGVGIVVGTDTIITPEPASWSLVLCGAGLFAMRRYARAKV